jgi:hypothetical protein
MGTVIAQDLFLPVKCSVCRYSPPLPLLSHLFTRLQRVITLICEQEQYFVWHVRVINEASHHEDVWRVEV